VPCNRPESHFGSKNGPKVECGTKIWIPKTKLKNEEFFPMKKPELLMMAIIYMWHLWRGTESLSSTLHFHYVPWGNCVFPKINISQNTDFPINYRVLTSSKLKLMVWGSLYYFPIFFHVYYRCLLSLPTHFFIPIFQIWLHGCLIWFISFP